MPGYQGELSRLIGARNPQEGKQELRGMYDRRVQSASDAMYNLSLMTGVNQPVPEDDYSTMSQVMKQPQADPRDWREGGETALNALIDAKNPVSGFLGTFGGQMAKKAPKEFDSALIGSITGKIKQGERSATGWRMGPDNQMRFEIDDKVARFSRDINTLKTEGGRTTLGGVDFTKTLDQVLDHPELFMQYPDLAKVKVYKTNEEGLRGSFMAHWNKKGALDGGTIKLNPKDRTESQMMGTMLHEVQHWIQTIENFSPGSSTKQFEQLLSNKTRVQKHAIRTSNTSKIAKLMRSKSISREEAAKELGMKYGKYNIGVLDEYTKSGDIQQLLINERVARQEWDVLKGLSKDSTGWNYVRTLGEMEARDVSARYYMRQHAPQSDLERIPPAINRARTEVIDEGPYSGEIINPQTEALMLPADKPGGYIDIGGIKNVAGR